MIMIKTREQIALMQKAGELLHAVLTELRAMIKPGVTTLELDEYAYRRITAAGAQPSFKGYRGFPFTICASPDHQVVHGLSNTTPLREGQILSIDCGVILDGWQADSAFTQGVGQVSPKARKLMEVTEECFFIGAAQAMVGNRVGDISGAIQSHAESHGYSLIRALCGHGIGRQMHEDPEVPNFGEAGRGMRLREGMVLAIEPMVAAGEYHVNFEDDGWTVYTKDHGLCSHYEHTVAVTADGPRLLTLPEQCS